MWLEYKHQTFVWIFFRRGQRSADLCRMMCIIINDRNAIYASFILETSVRTAESRKPCKNVFFWDLQIKGKGNGSESVGNIVQSRYIQGDIHDFLAVVHGSKACTCFFVKGNVSRIKIAGITHAVGNDLWSESLYDLLIVLNFAVDDNGTIFFCIFRK